MGIGDRARREPSTLSHPLAAVAVAVLIVSLGVGAAFPTGKDLSRPQRVNSVARVDDTFVVSTVVEDTATLFYASTDGRAWEQIRISGGSLYPPGPVCDATRCYRIADGSFQTTPTNGDAWEPVRFQSAVRRAFPERFEPVCVTDACYRITGGVVEVGPSDMSTWRRLPIALSPLNERAGARDLASIGEVVVVALSRDGILRIEDGRWENIGIGLAGPPTDPPGYWPSSVVRWYGPNGSRSGLIWLVMTALVTNAVVVAWNAPRTQRRSVRPAAAGAAGASIAWGFSTLAALQTHPAGLATWGVPSWAAAVLDPVLGFGVPIGAGVVLTQAVRRHMPGGIWIRLLVATAAVPFIVTWISWSLG